MSEPPIIELTTVEPAQVFKDISPENAFLWQTEPKPAGEVPEPKKEDVQLILVYPNTEREIRLAFNVADPNLTDRVAEVCNSFFVTSGSPGVSDFQNSIGNPVNLAPETTPRRFVLYVEVEAWQRWLAAFAEKVVARTQFVACEIAGKKLDQTLKQTLGEAVRYLRSGQFGGSPGTGQLVLPNSPLTGPDVASLAGALSKVAAMRRELDLLKAESAQARDRIRGVGFVDSGSGVLGPGLLHAAAAQDLRSLSAVDDLRSLSALDSATLAYEAGERAFVLECTALCQLHPVLHRLASKPIVLQVADIWDNTLPEERLAALQADGSLALALSNVLNEITDAAFRFQNDLRVNPNDIWRYEKPIHAALEAMHLNEGDIAWRVASEHLQARTSGMSTLSRLSFGLNAVELIAAAAAVAPPVAAVLAILSAGAGVAELVEGALNEGQKDLAFQACLDPAMCVAVEGGNYAGVVIGAAFMLLQFRDLGRSVARLERR
jgi:hypothetical protein